MMDSRLQAFIATHGLEPQDVRIASASADPFGSGCVTITAMRVPGVASEELRRFIQSTMPTTTFTPVVMFNRPVLLTRQGQGVTGLIYGTGDSVYLLSAGISDCTREALHELLLRVE
jgi:hypothetical protein